MAVYQSYGYGSEKTAVVFDIGTVYTKVGFATENGPRSIVKTEIRRNDMLIPVHEFENSEDLYNKYLDFFHILYFRHLLVNPKERRVVIVESLLLPTVFRNTIAKVLFQHYEVPSLLFAPSHLVSLLTLGIPSGIVMDLGYKETLVLPVYEGTVMIKGCQSLPLAAQAVHSLLEAKLLENATVTYQGVNKPLASVMDAVEERVLEDIKVRCCFVTTFERAQKLHAVNQGKLQPNEAPAPPPGVDYPLDGGKIMHVDGAIRENVCEILFEEDNEEKSIATLIIESILQCPVDIRTTLASHLLLTGGSAHLPGLQHRLLCELRRLVASGRYPAHAQNWNFRFLKPPAKPNYTAWLGGAIMASVEVLASRSLSLKQYREQPLLPDWCSLFEHEDKEDKTLLALKTEKPVGVSSLTPASSTAGTATPLTASGAASGGPGAGGESGAAGARTKLSPRKPSPIAQLVRASPTKSQQVASTPSTGTSKTGPVASTSAKTVTSTPKTK